LQVVIARRNGEQQYSETGKTFFQGFSFLLSLAVALCLLSQILSPVLLKHLIASDAVYNAVIRYLDGRIWGLFFSFPFLALRSFLVGITQTKALNMAAFTAVLVNIPMNWILIFGFGMGISGAAIASSLAELCSLIVLTAYVFRHINRHLYGLHWSMDMTVLKEILSISVWSMLQFFMSVAIWFLFFLAIERLGEMELAVSNIVRSVSALFSVIVNALSGVTSSLVSNLIGAGEKKNVFPLCRRVIRLGYAAGVPLIALALLFHQPIIGAYTDNPTIVQVAWLPFAVMLLNYFFALPGYVYLNAVTGTGATRTVFIFQVTTTIAYLSCLWGLSRWSVPLAAYWSVEYLYAILLGIQAIIYLKYKR
ncbi:MATE family efflux transporter, partial [Bacteroides acidifaciens]